MEILTIMWQTFEWTTGIIFGLMLAGILQAAIWGFIVFLIMRGEK